MLSLWLAACAAAPTTPGEETLPTAASAAPVTPEAALLEGLPPGERYLQLRLMAGVTDGVDGPLAGALATRYGPPDGTTPPLPDLDRYRGAGYRIASAESLLEALSDLTAFREAAGASLDSELRRLESAHPELTEQVDEEILAEEILLVRSAVLDALETLRTAGELPDGLSLDSYRTGTLRARNELEYVDFARDMDRLAARSITETEGRLDAFHRTMDDSNDTAFLRERILAAEEMNRQITDEHREYATRRTIRTLIFLLPALSSYFRYR